LGEHRVAYRRAGAGAPVVLVHGITTYGFLWDEIARDLARDHDVVVMDLLGCGDSDKPLDVSYSLSAHADRLPRFLDALGLGRVHLVGHDLGGGIAQIFSARHSERLASVSLINSVAFDFWPVQPITLLRTSIIRQLLMASLDFGSFRLLVRRGVFHTERVTDALMEQFLRPLQDPLGRKAFLHFARCLDNRDLTAITSELEQLALPALILRGDADVYLGAANSERLHATMPGSRLERIATGGHFLQFDEPAWITEQLRRFFEEHRDRLDH
jgi:pimeloyl-ACP methyl ester carboxylesterase